MSLPKEALRKLTKDEFVNLSLYQINFNLTLANIDKDIGEPRKGFEKLETQN